jgi:hypothetical protein
MREKFTNQELYSGWCPNLNPVLQSYHAYDVASEQKKRNQFELGITIQIHQLAMG